MNILDFKISGRLQILFWLLTLLSLAVYILGKQIPEATIQEFIGGFGPWGPVIFILVGQIPYIIAPINSLPLLIAGFYLFGPTTVLYHYPTALIGFTLNFYISRRWGRPFLRKMLDEASVSKIDELAKTHGLLTLVVLRAFQGGLGDYVSYAYGLTKMPYKKYIVASALAIIPGLATLYYFASRAQNIEGFLAVNWIISIFCISLVLVGSYVWRKMKKVES